MTPPNQSDNTKRSKATNAKERTVDLDEFRKRLADEYKILQDKIDKIGAFPSVPT